MCFSWFISNRRRQIIYLFICIILTSLLATSYLSTFIMSTIKSITPFSTKLLSTSFHTSHLKNAKISNSYPSVWSCFGLLCILMNSSHSSLKMMFLLYLFKIFLLVYPQSNQTHNHCQNINCSSLNVFLFW